MLRAILLLALAGLAEIGGGYLVWRWLREDAVLWVGLVGALILVLYGVIHSDMAGRRSLRSGLCGLRRGIRRAIAPLGLVARWHPARSL